MGMTIIEKILARKSGAARVAPGDLAVVDVDCVVMIDLSFGQGSWREVLKVHDPDKVVVVFDHDVPASNRAAAAMHARGRDFARRFGGGDRGGGSAMSSSPRTPTRCPAPCGLLELAYLQRRGAELRRTRPRRPRPAVCADDGQYLVPGRRDHPLLSRSFAAGVSARPVSAYRRQLGPRTECRVRRVGLVFLDRRVCRQRDGRGLSAEFADLRAG